MPDISSSTHQSSRDLSRIILKNSAIITAGGLVLKALNFAFGIYVVRQLGDDRFGQYSIILGFTGLFSVFLELGVTQYAMREIARDRSRASALFWNLVAVRSALALAGIILIPLAAWAAGYSQTLVLGVFFYAWTFLLSAFEVPLETVLSAHERLDYVTALSVLGQVAFMALGTIVLFTQLGLVALIAVGLIAMLPQIALAAWAVKRHHMLDWTIRLNPSTWPALIRAGIPFGITSLALRIAFSIDTVMLSWYQPERVVGWYNVAYNLARSLVALLGGFLTAMVPSLSRAFVTDPTQVERWYSRTVKFIMLLSMPMAVGGMLVAFPLIQFLYQGAARPAALGLQILIWDVPLLMFTAFCGNMTTIAGEERGAARIYSINAIANVILNLYAIPTFGLVGAALVTVVTDLIGALQFHFLLSRKLHLPNLTSVLARVILASALMGLAIRAAQNLNLFLLIGLGVAIYGGLVLMLGVIDRAEWALVGRLFSHLTDISTRRIEP